MTAVRERHRPLPPGALFHADYLATARRRRFSQRLLLVAMYDPRGIPTIYEQIDQLCALSSFPVDLLNLWGLPSEGGLEIPAGIDLAGYGGLVIHCTTGYNVTNLLSLDRQLDTKIAEYGGLKILMKQDEHYRTHAIADYLGSRRFDAVVTLVAEPDRLRFYPPERAGKLRFIPWLTAYVTEEMRALRAPPLTLRPFDVGYRGSLQPWYFGTLAFDKREIGERFRTFGAARGLLMDISSRWEDRFSGRAWYDFLFRCKAILGVESGASIVDFEGEAERRVTAYLAQHPGASFEKAFADVIGAFEGNCQYRTISPRHFEAAACKCVQVLYEGDYAGIFEADRHYIALRRDFANIDEVLDRLESLESCQAMVDRAFEEVILDRRYSYAAFIERLDAAIAEAFVERAAATVQRR
jgi:hypothetical protein